MEGLIFGLIDNGVLIIGAYTGLEIDRLFKGNGALGAVIGAGLGNTISDGLGALIDPTLNAAFLGIVIGCLIPLLMIPVIEKFKTNRGENND
jgi:hypothetical protein